MKVSRQVPFQDLYEIDEANILKLGHPLGGLIYFLSVSYTCEINIVLGSRYTFAGFGTVS